MTLTDLVTAFSDVTMCMLRRTVAEGGIWHAFSAAGQWSVADDTAPGCNGPDAWRNPQFVVAPLHPCRFVVTLEQLHLASGLGRKSENLCIGMQLTDPKGRGLARLPRSDCGVAPDDEVLIKSAQYCNRREVVIESGSAEIGGVLSLLVAAFDKGVERKFVVTIWPRRRCAARRSRLMGER